MSGGSVQIQLPHEAHYRGRAEALNTTTGLSIRAVIGGLSLLCDALADLDVHVYRRLTQDITVPKRHVELMVLIGKNQRLDDVAVSQNGVKSTPATPPSKHLAST
jgi:hypothetical protein